MSFESCVDFVNGFCVCDIGICLRNVVIFGCFLLLVWCYVVCEYWLVRIFVFKFSMKGVFRVFNVIMKLVWC